MSIKPKFVEKIISHEKLYEFRKSIFKKAPEKIFIYSTSPQREIVGYFKPSKIIHDSPDNLWDSFSKVSGIFKADFFNYFENTPKGYAIKIDNLYVFPNPLKMINFTDFNAPQSFCYIENNKFLRQLLLKSF